MTIDNFKTIKSGDFIVCIKTLKMNDVITFGKKYKVIHIEDCYNEFYIENEFNIGIYVNYKYFVTLKEYEIIIRKNKLKKIMK